MLPYIGNSITFHVRLYTTLSPAVIYYLDRLENTRLFAVEDRTWEAEYGMPRVQVRLPAHGAKTWRFTDQIGRVDLAPEMAAGMSITKVQSCTLMFLFITFYHVDGRTRPTLTRVIFGAWFCC